MQYIEVKIIDDRQCVRKTAEYALPLDWETMSTREQKNFLAYVEIFALRERFHASATVVGTVDVIPEKAAGTYQRSGLG